MHVTPSYCARAAPVEVGWANIKNPISKVETKSLAHLEQQVIESVRAHCTESMWLGAYRTTRQWEDEIYERLACNVPDAVPSGGRGGGDVADATSEDCDEDTDEDTDEEEE